MQIGWLPEQAAAAVAAAKTAKAASQTANASRASIAAFQAMSAEAHRQIQHLEVTATAEVDLKDAAALADRSRRSAAADGIHRSAAAYRSRRPAAADRSRRPAAADRGRRSAAAEITKSSESDDVIVRSDLLRTEDGERFYFPSQALPKEDDLRLVDNLGSKGDGLENNGESIAGGERLSILDPQPLLDREVTAASTQL